MVPSIKRVWAEEANRLNAEAHRAMARRQFGTAARVRAEEREIREVIRDA